MKAFLSVIIAATIGATAGVFVKYLNLPPTTVTFFRVSVPVLVLGAYLLFKQVRLFKGNVRQLLFASFLNAVRLLLYYIGYTYTTIGNGVIILFTWPIFASIFSAMMLREKLSDKDLVLLMMSFLGILIMNADQELSFGNRDFIGMGAMLASAIIFALAMTTFKDELKRYSRAETVFYQNFVGVFVFLPFMFINPLPSMNQTAGASVLGLLTGVVGFMLFFYALKRMKMAHYGILTYWEVIGAVILGIILFREAFSLNHLIGGAMIIGSSLTITQSKAES